jgi:hypothetical protein
VFKIDEISSSINARQQLMLKNEQYSRSSTCLIEVFKIWSLQNSNQSHYKHNFFDDNFMCLTDGNDIMLEVLHVRPPKSLI